MKHKKIDRSLFYHLSFHRHHPTPTGQPVLIKARNNSISRSLYTVSSALVSLNSTMKTTILPLVLGLILAVNYSAAKTIQSRVVGGRDTTIEQHPYMLSLEYHNEHYAGAVLIRRNIALTGAQAFLK